MNVQNNMDLQYVNRLIFMINFTELILFFAVKQRRNQHRRDFSDANADNKVEEFDFQIIILFIF